MACLPSGIRDRGRPFFHLCPRVRSYPLVGGGVPLVSNPVVPCEVWLVNVCSSSRVHSLFFPLLRLLLTPLKLSPDGDVVGACTAAVVIALDRCKTESGGKGIFLLLLEFSDFFLAALGLGLGVIITIARVPVDVLVRLPPSDRRIYSMAKVVF